MSIQYPKLEHVTLPSVEGFNGTFNILRDPPKSIFTKRIDKVGQNNSLNDSIDESSDRMSEGIKVYARGVNPMVSVSYDNNSNNAGSFTNAAFGQGNNIGQGHHQGKKQAFLPYRIADKGAFRPPIRSQFDLLPLSRQPRAWFQALTNPGFIDYTKQKYLPTKFRMIRELTLKTNQLIKPNSSVKVDKPIMENYKMQQAINDKHISIEAFSGKRTIDHSNFTRENVDKYKGIQENYEQVHATTNKQDRRSHNLSDMSIRKDNYIHDKIYYDASSNPSLPVNQSLEGMEIDREQYIGNKDYYDASSNPSLQTNQGLDGLYIDEDKYIYDHAYYDASSNRSMQTNQGVGGMDIDREQYIGNKDYYDVTASKRENIQVTSLDEMYSNNKTSVKDVTQYNTNAGKKTGYTLLTEIPNMELEHHMPRYNMTASLNDPTFYKHVMHENEINLHQNLPSVNTVRNVTRVEELNNFDYGSSRDYKLPPTLQKGQFLNAGVQPTLDRSEIQFRQDPNKEKIRKYLNDAQFSRFNH